MDVQSRLNVTAASPRVTRSISRPPSAVFQTHTHSSRAAYTSALPLGFSGTLTIQRRWLRESGLAPPRCVPFVSGILELLRVQKLMTLASRFIARTVPANAWLLLSNPLSGRLRSKGSQTRRWEAILERPAGHAAATGLAFQGGLCMQVQRAISPKVFISYARQDSSDLAEELVTALEVLKFDGYLDRHDIAAGEDWEHRLDLLIRQADTIVFIISNCSVRSERCAWEVARAIDLAKRIVPVVGMSVDEAAVPPSLQRLNYIHFTVGHSFARSLGQLANAIGLDIDWIREHTRLGELALRWNERRQPDALLLRGEELASGQAWMENWQPELPSPTNIHRQFIAASADAHERRESLERQQNETLARANIDRIDALARREEAVEQMRRRTILAGAVGLTFSFGLGGMAWWTLRASRRAEEPPVPI